LHPFAPIHFTFALCAIMVLGPLMALEQLMVELPCARAVLAMNIIAAAEARSAPFLADFIVETPSNFLTGLYIGDILFCRLPGDSRSLLESYSAAR
jgi:hypothetical protein